MQVDSPTLRLIMGGVLAICLLWGVGGSQVTPILGEPQAAVGQAKEWARTRQAHDRFIAIADAYWRYGQQTGIRPEVAYAQAAKETAFGRYGGAVKPEQNNWAGIKTATAQGDRPQDHDTFASPEDGVRAHFNHLAAYTGRDPIGEPHGRYHLVMTIDWAGSVRHVEELGGKWAPSPDYGISIVEDYMADMLATDEFAGHWAEESLRWATDQGLLGPVRPDDPVTQAQLAVLLKHLY